MLLTLPQGITMGILSILAAAAGWQLGSKSSVTPDNTLFALNESAPIVSVSGKQMTLAELDSVSRMELARLSAELVLRAQNLALRQFAVRHYAKQLGKGESWRDVLSSQLSDESLRKTYSDFPSFSQSGPYEIVFPEVERFVLDIERNKLLGAFIHTVGDQKELSVGIHRSLEVQLPFDVTEFPVIYLGSENGKISPEVQVIFRYAGQLSNSAFSLIEKIAHDNQLLIPVRIIPEKTPSSYDEFAISSIFEAAKSKSKSELTQLHLQLLKNSPALSELSDDGVVTEAIGKMQNQKSLEILGHQSTNLESVSRWYRDIRTSKTPIFFVSKTFVSEVHPKGFAYAFLNSLTR